MATSRICSIPDCGKTVHSRDVCQAHYRKLMKYGDPLKRLVDPEAPRRYLSETVIPYSGDECLIWPFNRVQYGYGRIHLAGEVFTVHRLVCAATHGPAPADKPQAAHFCGNGHLGCVSPNHLRWATMAENAHDKIDHGTSSRGTKNPTAILNEAMVREIRQMKGTVTQNDIAKKFGVSKQTVSLVLKGGVWGWVT